MTDPPTRPAIPDFSAPPVSEVALGVQFPAIEGLTMAHLALFWGRLREQYPVVREQPLLDPAEELESSPLGLQGLHLQMVSMPAPARLWFLTTDESQLVQVQRDRFIRNWRRLNPNVEYPRYEPLRQSFLTDWNHFTRFLLDEGLPAPAPSLCEVTYINHITADIGDVFTGHDEVAKVVNWGICTTGLPPLEEFRVNQRHVLRNAEGGFVGRLHIGLEPVRRASDGVRAFALTFIARGVPREQSLEGVLQFLDRGRREIVEGFAAVTTERMHEVWGRKQ